MTNYSASTEYVNKSPIILEPDNVESTSNGEKCTFEIADIYNISKDGKYDNTVITKTDQDKIDIYSVDETGVEQSGNLQYSLCNKDGNDYYYNCALNHNNIWLTRNGDKCEINNNIALPPDSFTKAEPNNDIKTLKKPQPFKFIKDLSYSSDSIVLCNKRWYDWFTIPDFHNGNNYSRERDGDTFRCFKPCKFGSISINNTEETSAFFGENKTKCINRDLIDNGKIKNTLLFTPYSIIFLCGLTDNDLIELYKHEIQNIESIVNNNNNSVDKLYDIEIDNNLLKEITESDTTIENIITDIKEQMKKSIEQLVTEPISHLNIIPPHDNLNNLNYAPKKYYSDKKYIIKAYEIANKIYTYLSDVTLKSDFYLWKKELAKVNNFDINSWEFNKVLLLLQASCTLCFGYQNPKDILYKQQKEYNEYVMNNLFKFNDNNVKFERINYPKITNTQVLKSVDTNNPFHNMNDDTLLSISLSKVKDFQTEYIDDGTLDETPNDMIKVNKCNIKFYDDSNTLITNKDNCNVEDSVNLINIDMIDNSFSSYLISVTNCFFVIITIILFIFVSYLLIILIWPNIANVINYIILGFIWIVAVFIGCFQSLTFKAPNNKGIILKIHRLALKGELWMDKYMRTIAMLNADTQLPFYFILGLAGVLIAGVVFKSFFDLVLIFIADSKFNHSSNKSSNAIKYVFSC